MWQGESLADDQEGLDISNVTYENWPLTKKFKKKVKVLPLKR